MKRHAIFVAVYTYADGRARERDFSAVRNLTVNLQGVISLLIGVCSQ